MQKIGGLRPRCGTSKDSKELGKAMGEWMRSIMVMVILGYISLAGMQIAMFMYVMESDETIFMVVGETIRERDQRMFALQNRLNALEKERGLEKRLRDIERQLRTFCTGEKIDLCASLGKVK